MTEGGKKCGVCDHINTIATPTCSNCNARLMKKRARGRSKQSKGKDKYKRKKPECSGNKVTYPTRADSRRSAKRIRESKGAYTRSYHCKTCKGWHLTKYHS